MAQAGVRGGLGAALGLAVASVALWAALNVAAQAAERVALVIGNHEYKHVRDLVNPKKDAADIGAALARLGFAVTPLENAGYQDLRQGLQRFEEAAARSKIAVVFYAGHGIEVDKHNYLVPVEARLATDRAVKYEAIPLDVVMAAVEGASTLGLVILDACRDNPFLAMMQSTGLKRSVDRGLAREEPRGTETSMMVAYSAKEGTTAADGAPGGNSPYAEALLKHLETPGLHVGDLFIAVRQEMLAKPGSQRPVEYGSLVEKVYLASAPLPKVTGATSGGTPPPPPPGGAKEAYEEAKEVGTVAAYRIVVEDFPGTRYARFAQAWIDKYEQEPLVVAGGDDVDEAPPVATPAAPSPEAVEQGLGLSREERRLVQRGLAAAGYAAGPADGRFGGRTRAALRRWQGSKRMEVTGYLTKAQGEVLAALGREAAQRRQAEAEAEERREREAEERRKRARKPGDRFRDCPGCPEMVVVPSGRFRMGSPSSEAGRTDDGREGPVHPVTIGYRLAVGVHEVTRGEFARFVSATGRSMGNACWTHEGGEWKERSGRHWKSPGFSQTDSHPVVCVNWNDAQAYVRWLSGRTGEEYRLLSESEWEYVARAGTRTARYWGESERGQCRYANGADRTAKRHNSGWTTAADCDDGHYRTAPVGSYEANGFGLRDVLGNVWEWVEDCWNGSYAGAPRDGSAWKSGECGRRVLRGGSWSSFPGYLRSAYRGRLTSGGRYFYAGLRVARTLTP